MSTFWNNVLSTYKEQIIREFVEAQLMESMNEADVKETLKNVLRISKSISALHDAALAHPSTDGDILSSALNDHHPDLDRDEKYKLLQSVMKHSSFGDVTDQSLSSFIDTLPTTHHNDEVRVLERLGISGTIDTLQLLTKKELPKTKEIKNRIVDSMTHAQLKEYAKNSV